MPNKLLRFMRCSCKRYKIASRTAYQNKWYWNVVLKGICMMSCWYYVSVYDLRNNFVDSSRGYIYCIEVKWWLVYWCCHWRYPVTPLSPLIIRKITFNNLNKTNGNVTQIKSVLRWNKVLGVSEWPMWMCCVFCDVLCK